MTSDYSSSSNRVAHQPTLMTSQIHGRATMCTGRSCGRIVDVVKTDESVWSAAERMHERGVRALVVVNADREPVGIVTDRDLLERVLTKRLNPDKTLVRQIMTMDPQTIYEGAPLDAALLLMREGGFRRL